MLANPHPVSSAVTALVSERLKRDAIGQNVLGQLDQFLESGNQKGRQSEF